MPQPNARTMLQDILDRNMATAERYGADTGHDIPDQAAQIAAHNAGANDVEWEPEPEVRADTRHTHPDIDAALGRAAHKDDVRELRAELGELRARLAAAPPAVNTSAEPPLDIGRDLYERATSRVFLVPLVLCIFLALSAWQGGISWPDAFDQMKILVLGAIGVEGARDVAAALKGRASASAPPPSSPDTTA